MNGSASDAASGESSGWPASFASALAASSRARAPRRSGVKYACRKLTRAGSANPSLCFAYQAFSSSVLGSCAAATSSARNCIFCAMRRFTMVSSLSRPSASASR